MGEPSRPEPKHADASANSRGGGEELPFESALARLEEIVDRLERGDLPLEEALAAFEEGVGLSRRCAGELSSAERRIEVLMEGEDGGRSEPFMSAPEDEVPED